MGAPICYFWGSLQENPYVGISIEKRKKTNKAKIPYDNHAKPLRKSKKSKKSKVFRRMQVGAYQLALPHEILLFLLW